MLAARFAGESDCADRAGLSRRITCQLNAGPDGGFPEIFPALRNAEGLPGNKAFEILTFQIAIELKVELFRQFSFCR